MSGSGSGPDIETLAEAGQEFAKGNISQSQLEQVQSGQASLDEVRSSDSESDGGGGTSSSPQVTTNPGGAVENTSGSSSSGGGGGSDSDSSSLQATTNPGGAVGNTPQQEQSQQQQDSSSPQATTNPGGAVGNTPQQEQDGIDAPSIQELSELGQEFASSGGDVSQEDLESADARFQADVTGDGTIDDADAEQLADAGQFEAAQALEEEIDQATGTEGDGTPDDLTAPTVEDSIARTL